MTIAAFRERDTFDMQAMPRAIHATGSAASQTNHKRSSFSAENVYRNVLMAESKGKFGYGIAAKR